MLTLFCGISLKIVIYIICILILRRFNKRPFHLELAFSWLFSYALILIGMIILSVFHLLNKEFLLLYLAFLSLILGIIYYLIVPQKDTSLKSFLRSAHFASKNILNISSVFIIVAFFALLLIRNLLYYDTTDDALMQGMPKLAFIQQHASLFVKYDTWSVNIFSNEWFGELNGLFYLILSGEDHLILLGNTEIYLFILITIIGLIKELGYTENKLYVIAGYLSTLPVITGLAMTLKTDLISFVMAPLAIVVMKKYLENETDFWLTLTIVALGATASAKITLLPLVGLLSISLMIFYLFRVNRKRIFCPVVGILFACIFCIRYIINLFQYHNPVQRSLNEKINISITNLLENIVGIFSRFLETQRLIDTISPYASSNWVLTKGMGYGGEFLLIVLTFSGISFLCKPVKKKNYLYIIIPYIGAVIFVLLGTVWYDWSFRYYFPYIFTLVIVSIVYTINQLSSSKKPYSIIKLIIYFSMCIYMGANSIQAFRYGQAIPQKASYVKNMSKTEQKLLWSSIPKYSDLAEISSLIEVLENGGKGVVLDEFSVPFYQFFGDNHCVELDLVKYERQLMNIYKNYDFIAIASRNYNKSNYLSFEQEMRKENYTKYSGSYGAIFIKE